MVDDTAAIRLMVELIAEDPQQEIRPAARKAIRQLALPGDPSRHEERLRKKYVRLRDAVPSRLPEPEYYLRAERFFHETEAFEQAARRQAREELEVMEREAISQGIDIGPPDLTLLLETLRQDRDGLQILLFDLRFTRSKYRERGLSTPEEMMAAYMVDRQRLARLTKQVELVTNIDMRRRFLGLSRDSSPASSPTDQESG